MQLSPQVRSQLAMLGIRNPDPESELHQNLVDTFTRLGEMDVDVLYPALMWCYHAEHERQVALYASSKTEYERVLGAGVIRYRMQGEKSAEVAKMKAESQDEGVYQTHLEYRKAEHGITAAKLGIQILRDQLSAWQTRQANARKADEIAAGRP